MRTCWYLLHTKTNSEHIAKANLERQGYESYLPQFVRRFFRHGQRMQRIGPLFPGYLFVNLKIGVQDLTSAKSTKGVLNVVRFGEEYAIVPHAVMEEIHRRADRQTGLHSIADKRPHPNSPIRVTNGPMEGLEGIFVRQCGEDRVLILLTILGQGRTVQLPEYSIELQTA